MFVQAFNRSICRLPRFNRYVLGSLMFVLVAALDFVTGPVLSSAFFYMLPILYFGWYLGANQAFLVSFISSLLWLLSDLTSGYDFQHPMIPYWNAFVRLLVFLSISYFVIRLQLELQAQQAANEKLKTANEHILRLSSLKSEFVSLVSHELRTPLTIIGESARIIHDGSAGTINSEQKDFLDTVIRNSQRLARLINDVLDFQKLEAGKMTYSITKGDINTLARDIVSGFQVVAKMKNLTLELQLENNLPQLSFDYDKISQVLTNLIGNAVKFSSLGVITIATKRTPEGVRVSIKDQGSGIAEEDIPNLFQSFTQVGPQHLRSSGGTGLGLAISKKVIEDHGGTIGVESSPGKGSTFFFILKEM